MLVVWQYNICMYVVDPEVRLCTPNAAGPNLPRLSHCGNALASTARKQHTPAIRASAHPNTNAATQHKNTKKRSAQRAHKALEACPHAGLPELLAFFKHVDKYVAKQCAPEHEIQLECSCANLSSLCVLRALYFARFACCEQAILLRSSCARRVFVVVC